MKFHKNLLELSYLSFLLLEEDKKYFVLYVLTLINLNTSCKEMMFLLPIEMKLVILSSRILCISWCIYAHTPRYAPYKCADKPTKLFIYPQSCTHVFNIPLICCIDTSNFSLFYFKSVHRQRLNFEVSCLFHIPYVPYLFSYSLQNKISMIKIHQIYSNQTFSSRAFATFIDGYISIKIHLPFNELEPKFGHMTLRYLHNNATRKDTIINYWCASLTLDELFKNAL